MTEEPHSSNIVIEKVQNHRLATMITGAIVIAMLLVAVALSLYSSSGAEQLDLSRPGLEDVREQAARDDGGYVGFSPTGVLNDKAYEEFDRLYSEKLKEAQSVNAFGGDVLSPKALQIDQDSALKVVAP